MILKYQYGHWSDITESLSPEEYMAVSSEFGDVLSGIQEEMDRVMKTLKKME